MDEPRRLTPIVREADNFAAEGAVHALNITIPPSILARARVTE
jgi:hypothetical protein